MTISIQIEELQHDQLPRSQQELVREAIEATRHSYARYSLFNVGAAVRLADGRIFRGANQENAAFTVGICAERTAIYSAQANCPEQPITEIAIAARNADGLTKSPISPCGSCRQVMLEMEDRYRNSLTVLLYGTTKVYRLRTVRDLLPLCFVDADMR